MKEFAIIQLLTLNSIVISFAQTETKVQIASDSNVTYQNVQMESIDVNGTKFVYRKLGSDKNGVPVIFINHLAGVLDDWDPRVVDGIAKEHLIITFDNRGIGTSEGVTPQTVEEMADDASAFIKALGYKQVDILGFSLGGAVAQTVTLKEPQLVRKLILAGTGPAGSFGADKITSIAYRNQLKSLLTFKDVRTYLFFT